MRARLDLFTPTPLRLSILAMVRIGKQSTTLFFSRLQRLSGRAIRLLLLFFGEILCIAQPWVCGHTKGVFIFSFPS
jgi:hypothetical protein